MNPPSGFDFVESSVFRGPQKLVAQTIVRKVAISFNSHNVHKPCRCISIWSLMRQGNFHAFFVDNLHLSCVVTMTMAIGFQNLYWICGNLGSQVSHLQTQESDKKPYTSLAKLSSLPSNSFLFSSTTISSFLPQTHFFTTDVKGHNYKKLLQIKWTKDNRRNKNMQSSRKPAICYNEIFKRVVVMQMVIGANIWKWGHKWRKETKGLGLIIDRDREDVCFTRYGQGLNYVLKPASFLWENVTVAVFITRFN